MTIIIVSSYDVVDSVFQCIAAFNHSLYPGSLTLAPSRLLQSFDIILVRYFYGFMDFHCVEKGIKLPVILVGGSHLELNPVKSMLMNRYLNTAV